jgi:hypothetical protein
MNEASPVVGGRRSAVHSTTTASNRTTNPTRRRARRACLFRMERLDGGRRRSLFFQSTAQRLGIFVPHEATGGP